MGGMGMRADIWIMLSWNLLEGGPHDFMLPPDKDPEVQAALRKVEETFELEPRTEAMRELNRIAESRSYDIKTMHYRTEAVAHDPGLDYDVLRRRQAPLGAERHPLGDVARRPHPLPPLHLGEGEGGLGAVPSPSGFSPARVPLTLTLSPKGERGSDPAGRGDPIPSLGEGGGEGPRPRGSGGGTREGGRGPP